MNDAGLRDSMNVAAKTGSIVDKRQEVFNDRNSFNFKDTVIANAGITYTECEEIVNKGPLYIDHINLKNEKKGIVKCTKQNYQDNISVQGDL